MLVERCKRFFSLNFDLYFFLIIFFIIYLLLLVVGVVFISFDLVLFLFIELSSDGFLGFFGGGLNLGFELIRSYL